jgi:ribosome-associated protein
VILIEDKGQKEGKHEIKNQYWKENGILVQRYPLPCGDYIALNDRVENVINRKVKRGVDIKKMDFVGTFNIAVDTKKDIQEIILNVTKDHARFKDELIFAQDNHIDLTVLVENKDNVACINDLYKWYNWRLKTSKKATTGRTLAQILSSLEFNYNVKFEFCRPDEAGARVVELLGVK